MLIRQVKLMTKCALLTLLSLGLLNFLSYMNAEAQRQQFSWRLTAAVERARSDKDVAEIRLKELTDFTWDRVHIFTSYIGTETIDENLGYAWQPARRIGIYQRDDISLLVFTNSEKVVFYVDKPRYPGDFDGSYKQGGYSPDEAVFKVVEGSKQPDGLPWIHLERK